MNVKELKDIRNDEFFILGKDVFSSNKPKIYYKKPNGFYTLSFYSSTLQPFELEKLSRVELASLTPKDPVLVLDLT